MRHPAIATVFLLGLTVGPFPAFAQSSALPSISESSPLDSVIPPSGGMVAAQYQQQTSPAYGMTGNNGYLGNRGSVTVYPGGVVQFGTPGFTTGQNYGQYGQQMPPGAINGALFGQGSQVPGSASERTADMFQAFPQQRQQQAATAQQGQEGSFASPGGTTPAVAPQTQVGAATPGNAQPGSGVALSPSPAVQGRLFRAGDEFAGRIDAPGNGTLVIGGTSVLLDGAELPRAIEVCGNGQFMTRCGALAQATLEGLLPRTSAARCMVVGNQATTDAPTHAFCSSGRQDLAQILISSGAARAADGRFMAHQVEAASDGRGMWAGLAPSAAQSDRLPPRRR